MNTKELPAHPSLEQYKKQAKEILKSVKSGNPAPLQSILERLKQDHPRPGRLAELETKGTELRLADAQFVIARDYGFESWPKFAKHIEGLTGKRSPVSAFEQAVDAVVTGELPTLERLLREIPGLVHERSARLHHATLLHYVGANGVENYRQKTPKNAVKIAETLLKAGADIAADADIYGGSDTLGLAATSVFPALTGVQEELIDILLKHGAKLSDKLVNACLANGRGQAAEHLSNRGAPLDLEGAAGVGRLEEVKSFFNSGGTLKGNATQRQMECGFLWACEYGRTEVVDFLLQKGMRVDAMPHGETGLHWAAFTGRVDIVKRLLEKKAPLELRDKRHSATPLEWALHGWNNPPPGIERNDFYDVVALLAAAGAKLDPTRQRGSLVEKLRADVRMMAALGGEMPAPAE